MNKLILFVTVFFAASLFFSCDKTKTAQERLKEENKAIRRFIDNKDIIVTNNPDEMYDENVYYKTKEGLYINVIDSGNGNKVKKEKQEIVVRYEYSIKFKNDTTKISGNMSAGNSPYVFYYQKLSYQNDYEGLAIGLRLVSENARVNLIIPSMLQPSSMQGSYSPVFYGNLIYRFK